MRVVHRRAAQSRSVALCAGGAPARDHQRPIRRSIRLREHVDVHPREYRQLPSRHRRVARGALRRRLRDRSLLHRYHLHRVLGDDRRRICVRRGLSIVTTSMRRDTKIVASFLSAIPIVILGASSLCAWAIAHGASTRWRLLFRMLCHGIEQRCLTMFGVPMPICARCAGIYIGLFAGVIAFLIFPMIEEQFMRTTMYFAALPMAIDGLTQALGLREST